MLQNPLTFLFQRERLSRTILVRAVATGQRCRSIAPALDGSGLLGHTHELSAAGPWRLRDRDRGHRDIADDVLARVHEHLAGLCAVTAAHEARRALNAEDWLCAWQLRRREHGARANTAEERWRLVEAPWHVLS